MNVPAAHDPSVKCSASMAEASTSNHVAATAPEKTALVEYMLNEIQRLECYRGPNEIATFPHNNKVYFYLTSHQGTIYYVHNDCSHAQHVFTPINLTANGKVTVCLNEGRAFKALHNTDKLVFHRDLFVTPIEGVPQPGEVVNKSNHVVCVWPVRSVMDFYVLPMALWWTPLSRVSLSDNPMLQKSANKLAYLTREDMALNITRVAVNPSRFRVQTSGDYIKCRLAAMRPGVTVNTPVRRLVELGKAPGDDNLDPEIDFSDALPLPVTLVSARRVNASGQFTYANYRAALEEVEDVNNDVLSFTDVMGRHGIRPLKRLTHDVSSTFDLFPETVILPNLRLMCKPATVLHYACSLRNVAWDMACAGFLLERAPRGLIRAILRMYRYDDLAASTDTEAWCGFWRRLHAFAPTAYMPREKVSACAVNLAVWESQHHGAEFFKVPEGMPVLERSRNERYIVYRYLQTTDAAKCVSLLGDVCLPIFRPIRPVSVTVWTGGEPKWHGASWVVAPVKTQTKEPASGLLCVCGGVLSVGMVPAISKQLFEENLETVLDELDSDYGLTVEVCRELWANLFMNGYNPMIYGYPDRGRHVFLQYIREMCYYCQYDTIACFVNDVVFCHGAMKYHKNVKTRK